MKIMTLGQMENVQGGSLVATGGFARLATGLAIVSGIAFADSYVVITKTC